MLYAITKCVPQFLHFVLFIVSFINNINPNVCLFCYQNNDLRLFCLILLFNLYGVISIIIIDYYITFPPALPPSLPPSVHPFAHGVPSPAEPCCGSGRGARRRPEVIGPDSVLRRWDRFLLDPTAAGSSLRPLAFQAACVAPRVAGGARCGAASPRPLRCLLFPFPPCFLSPN